MHLQLKEVETSWLKWGRHERKYGVKTAENINVIKVAWNGYPSLERAMKYEFKAPIIYILRDREKEEISVFLFEVEDVYRLKTEKKEKIWWIPRNGTNPRGFGLERETVKELIEIAKSKGNYITVNYSPLNMEEVSNEYWERWYELVKDLASKPYKFGQSL